ncbi:hypothetical protein D3C83_294510 [compost metagenome]
MCVGERIDPPMLGDPFTNGGRKPLAQRPLHEVAGEISDQRLRRIAGEKEVGQVVHDSE